MSQRRSAVWIYRPSRSQTGARTVTQTLLPLTTVNTVNSLHLQTSNLHSLDDPLELPPPQPSILTTLESISNSHLLSSSGTPVGSSSYLIYTSTFSPFGNGFLKIGPCEVYASHYLPSSPPARSPSPKSPRVSFFTSSWSRFLFGCNYLFVLSSFTISFILSPRGHFRASSCGPNFAFPCEGDRFLLHSPSSSSPLLLHLHIPRKTAPHDIQTCTLTTTFLPFEIPRFICLVCG